MKIIALEVISLDGKFTRWTGKNIYEWSSPEDYEHFVKVRSQNNLLVMGSETFLKVKDNPQAGLKAEKGRLRVVMTRTPQKFKQFTIPGKIEFTNKPPREVVADLEKRGYQQMLFVGGGTLLASFLKENLIDEVWLTLEPKIFGMGNILATGRKLDISLELLSVEKLNKKGSLLLKYSIEK
ncbi:MAG: dihydrofolate reductase family protein [Candidatus Levyibacteriota bacterium]